jgi:TP901 family phage tail tape measure protein
MSMANVQTSLAAVGARMQNFGRSATMYLTVPMALAGGAILKSAKDFEIAMQHIVGLVGISQNQVNQWSRDILSLSPQIARPPKELAEALYFVTSSGIKGAAALDVVTQSAKGAAAGLGETMSVADLVTSAMNAYKNSGLTASRSLDILTAAVREGKGEAAAFATQMGEVIPIAAKMGVSFDQVAAGMSAMTLTGTNVSEAATYMR